MGCFTCNKYLNSFFFTCRIMKQEVYKILASTENEQRLPNKFGKIFRTSSVIVLSLSLNLFFRNRELGGETQGLHTNSEYKANVECIR